MVLLVMMWVVWSLFPPSIFPAQAISVAMIPEADIIINVEKGFVLQRIGIYSHKVNEGIIHTFVSLNDLCKSLPGTEVCLRGPSFAKNSIELGTILSANDRHWSFSHYEKKDISTIVRREINSLLSNHRPGPFMPNITTNFHFFNGEFYINNQNDQLVDDTFHSTNENQEITFDNLKNTPLIVLEQLRNRHIGFNFLRNEEIYVILSPIMQSLEKSYESTSVQKLITDFTALVISQTVNAFRSCSINQEYSSSPPCLIISTLFTTPSSSTADKYTIFNLLPIPIIIDEHQYAYKNLPKTFAFNDLEQSVIVFDDFLLSKCTLSSIVQCSIEPIPILLSEMSCISQMFSIQPSQASDCEVTRTVSSNFAVLHIAHDVWIFNNLNRDNRCTMQPHQTEINDLSLMEDLVLQHVTCGKSIKCSDHRRLPSKCINKSFMIMDMKTRIYKPQANFHISLKPLKETIIAIYKKNMLSLLQEMQEYDDETVTLITRLYRKFFNLIIFIFLLFLSTIISVCTKYIYKKSQQQSNIIERRVNNLSDIFLGGANKV